MALTDTKEKLVDNDIIDIELPEVKKKRFRIDGDNNRILELDTSDFSIVDRINSAYKKLNDLATEAQSDSLTDAEDSEAVAKTIADIDNNMRNIIDEVFDSNVSEVCAPNGTMFDLFNGKYRFEHILEVLFKLYESNITEEFNKLSARMNTHTAKYTKKKKQ